MFQTSYLSFDVRRTECMEQTVFLMMTPMSNKTPEASPFQNINFGENVLDVLSEVFFPFLVFVIWDALSVCRYIHTHICIYIYI